MRRFLSFLLDLLFPPRCAACKREGDFLCAPCLETLEIRPIRSVPLAASHRPSDGALEGVIYAADYSANPALKAAIAQFKYRFTQPLADHLGDLMAQKLNELGMLKGKRALLVPVPLHKKRLRYRGFNQAQKLAEAIASRRDETLVLPWLQRIRHTSQQAKLSKAERQRNLNEAFALADPQIPLSTQCQAVGVDPEQCIFFLVDDVCTTGSTLESAAAALKRAGLKKVYGLVVAKAF